jgi:hypothetical protein
LIASGLHAEEWSAMNIKDPDKAIEVVGLFSDLILDKVYDKTEFIVHQSSKTLKAFKFFKEKAILLGVDYKGNKELPIEGILEFISNNAKEMLIYTSSKSFKEADRNKELHYLVKFGAFAADEKIYNFLSKIK